MARISRPPWPAHNIRSRQAVRQLGDDYCGCACALIVMKTIGITNLPTQADFYSFGGGTTFCVDTLASTLDDCCNGTPYADGWRGGWVPEWDNPSRRWDMIRRLSSPGPWIAHLRVPLERLGHFVVVTSATSERVDVVDPRPGIVYWMKGSEFVEFWNGQAVFSRARTS